MKKMTWIAVAISALVMVGCGAEVPGGASSPVVIDEPTPLPGSPDCAEAAAALGLTGTFVGTRIFEPWSSTDPFALDALGNTVSFTFTTPQKVFDWTATLGIDFILVRGYDTGTQVFAYAPEATSATGLSAPPASEGFPDDRVSYVKLCFDYEDEGEGCTLTQGYWKTHSKYGPAPLDDTWALLGEDTPFFLSGKTTFEVLRTSPRGNPYYVLAHQFIAARLNELAGASVADLGTALADAQALFESTTPAQAPAKRGQFISLAEKLADFNEGAIGPGHCDDVE